MQIIQHNRVCSNMQWNNIIGLDLDLLVLDTIVFKWNSCFHNDWITSASRRLVDGVILYLVVMGLQLEVYRKGEDELSTWTWTSMRNSMRSKIGKVT